MKKRILITGAAGFIGFHLALFLKRRGDDVIGYDHFNDYYSPRLKEDRAALLLQEGIEVIRGDICDPSSLSSLISQESVTNLVHLAAQAGVRASLTDPASYIKNNLEGFWHILEICRRYPSLVLTYASSSSVYGDSQEIPFSPSHKTDSPVSLYGATKKSNEIMAYSYHHLFHIRMTGLRYFTVYGPWGRPDMAYYSFSQAILAGEPIDLYNDGKMQRDFTYIDDIVEGTAAAIDAAKPWAIYNLGNHRPVPLLAFVQIIEEALGIQAKKRFLPMQKGDVVTTCADIESSRRELGFFPKTALEKGIPRFISWLKEYSSVRKESACFDSSFRSSC